MSDPGANEHRNFERFPFIEDVLVGGTRQCTSSDISEGGLYISAIQIFETDSVIDVTIPFRDEKLTLKAKVQYCQPGIGSGIMFIGLSDEKKARIKELIGSIANK